MRKRALVLSLISTLMLLFVPRLEAKACSCVASRSLAESYAGTNAVFEGRVVAVSKRFSWTLGASGYEAVYEVTRAWKGVHTKYVTVTTGTGGGDCGVTFPLGGKNRMFFSGTGNGFLGLSASSCTTSFPRADVMSAYGPGSTDLTNNWWLIYTPSTWPILLATIGLGALFLFGVWLKHHWWKSKKT